MPPRYGPQFNRNHRVGNRRLSLPAFAHNRVNSNNHSSKLYEQLQLSEGVGALPFRRVSLTTTGTTQIPVHQLLLSISGDSKISLQHTSVQQLSAIPEDHELIEDYQGQDEQIATDDDIDEPHILISDPAPDGGYGWVIVIASFLCNVIVDGIAYTFGLFFEEFVRHFDTTKGKVALCGSLLSGCYLGAGPIVSALANKYGCRFVTIMGSIVAFFAFLLSTMAPSIEVLMFTYGVLGGIGFGMIYLPAIVSVGYYFTTKRAFATGIAVCGSGVGAFLFAPFCQYLLGVMDWKNTLIILAALALNCSVFGALMRPLNVHAEAVLTDDSNTRTSSRKPLLQRIAEEKRRRLLSHSNSQFLLLMQNGNDTKDGVYDELKSRLMMNTEPGVHSTLNLDQLFSQPTQQQLSPIIEKKFNYSESSTPQSSAPGSPTNENKDPDIQLQDSAISLSGELTFPSSTTIAQQSPSSEGPNKLGGSIQTIVPPRGRRASGFRTVSESSTSASAAPPPLQVILSSGTPTHSRRSSLNKSQSIYVRPMYKKDIFYSGSTLQLPPNSSLQHMVESQGLIGGNMGQSVVSIPARDIIHKVQQQLALIEHDAKDPIEHSDTNCCSKLLSFLRIKDQKQDLTDGEFNSEKSNCLQFKIPPSVKNILKEMLDFSLIRESGAFTLLAVANVFGMMGFYVPFVYITQYAVHSVKENGVLISSERAALLISVIGITNTFGRLFFGWISDRINRNGIICGVRLTALTINNYCIFLCGLTVIAIPFCRTYTTVLIDCVLFGLFVSAYICLTSIILVDLLGLERLTNAFGLLSLFRGASSMLGPPLAGTLFDITNSYHITFATAGTLLIISSLISFLIPNRNLEEKEEDIECNV